MKRINVRSDNMDYRVERLKTQKECEPFAKNVKDPLPELGQDAIRRGIELRALEHGAETSAEVEALEAVYAYERVLFKNMERI